MQEMKFRAWDKKELKMFEVKALEFVEGCDPIAKGAGHYTPNVDIMQYIGLKDKNGKGICRGDIVRAVAEQQFAEQSGDFIIKMSFDYAWVLADERYEHGLGVSWGGWESLEVIGNIYENPTLLK